MLIVRLVLPILRIGKTLIEWTVDYTGPLAEFVKTIPILLMAVFVLFPVWSYPFLLLASQKVGAPGNYIIYVFWWLMMIAGIVGAAAVGYTRESA